MEDSTSEGLPKPPGDPVPEAPGPSPAGPPVPPSPTTLSVSAQVGENHWGHGIMVQLADGTSVAATPDWGSQGYETANDANGTEYYRYNWVHYTASVPENQSYTFTDTEGHTGLMDGFNPPPAPGSEHPLYLQIAASRWNHSFEVRTSDGAVFAVLADQMQGFWSTDATSQSWWTSYYHFNAISTYRYGLNWWVVDTTTGETAAPNTTDLSTWAAFDAEMDGDGDGLKNWYELLIGTNPNNTNTDGDNLNDGDELAVGRNPNSMDDDPNGGDTPITPPSNQPTQPTETQPVLHWAYASRTLDYIYNTDAELHLKDDGTPDEDDPRNYAGFWSVWGNWPNAGVDSEQLFAGQSPRSLNTLWNTLQTKMGFPANQMQANVLGNLIGEFPMVSAMHASYGDPSTNVNLSDSRIYMWVDTNTSAAISRQFLGVTYKLNYLTGENHIISTTPISLTIPQGGIVASVDVSVAGNANDEGATYIWMDLLPVKIDSRDRVVEGFIPYIDSSQAMRVGFECGAKSYGIYEIPQVGSSDSVHVYDGVNEIFSDSEVAQYANGSLQPKVWQQEVVFVRESGGVRFYTVSDTLDRFVVTLYADNHPVGTVTRQLTEDQDFTRLIAATTRFVAGEVPPEPRAWESFPAIPTGGGDPTGVQLAALPQPVADTQSLVAVGIVTPTALSSVWPLPAIDDTGTNNYWYEDAEVFAAFVLDVKEVASEAEWQAFSSTLSTIGYDVAPALQRASGSTPPPQGAVAGFTNPPPSNTRDEVSLPAEIANRGLVAKTLIFFFTKFAKAHVASCTGVVFGLWDGVKGDVEGVVDLLTFESLSHYLRLLGDPYYAACEAYKVYEFVADEGWSEWTDGAGNRRGIVGIVKNMIDEFTGVQQARLDIVFDAPDVQDPIYMQAYLVGYTVGYIGEQVVVSVLTAGAMKAGSVSKALKLGKSAVQSVLAQASTAAKKAAQASSKGFYSSFSRVARSASENRMIRKLACRMFSVPGCLRAGTLVWMADGSARPIETISHGDWVMSADPEKGTEPVPRMVESRVMTAHQHLRAFSIDMDGDSAADLTVQATDEHPFYVVGRGWTRADALCVNDVLRTTESLFAMVMSVDFVSEEVDAYNLDVGEPDSFFVWCPKGALLTHNLEGEVYLYGETPPSGQVGGRFDPIQNKWISNQRHHLFYDRWLQEKYDIPKVALKADFAPRTQFPCIELTLETHLAAHRRAWEWFGDKFNDGRLLRDNHLTSAQWASIDAHEMEELAELMLNAAKSAGANLGGSDGVHDVKKKLELIKNWDVGWLHKYLKGRGCR